MFLSLIQIQRSISFSGFYFIYFIFLLHICTAFLTIINAFNNDLYDKEEIIQLSIDSIHIVKSTNSPISTNIEDNKDQNEENELLLSLLTSYDNENEFQIKKNKPTDNEIPLINTSSSIHFIPSSLHFTEQSIAIPRMQTVIIINTDFEPLEIYTLIETTNEFHSLIFKPTNLSKYGENTTINIYYLPRTIGLKESTFIIKTNRGDFSYHVSGIGISNPYGLRPLINIEIPLNSTFEYTINFHNPFNYALNINEIYTSDENLIIELLTNKNQKNHLKKISQYHEQWYLKPYETKSIIKINYLTYRLGQLFGFICIKTNFSEKIILPIEINVVTRLGLYSNVDRLEFTTERFLPTVNKSIKISVHVFNHDLNPVIITDVRVTTQHQNYITVRYKSLPIPPDIYRLNQIADITIHLNLIPDYIQHIFGYVEVYTSMNYEEPALKIPFDQKIVHGSLNFKEEKTYFYISNNNQTEECRSIELFNQYNMPISVYNITINKFELLSRYIQINYSSSFVYLYPNQWNELLCIKLQQPSSLSTSFNNIQAVMDIYTNLSHFSLPIYLYNGYLNLELLNDHTNGGIQQNENNPLELIITSIPMNTIRIMRFILTNSNPIDINIKEFDFTILNAKIQLISIKSLDGNKTKIKNENNKNLSSIVIPKQHQAIFLLTLRGIHQPKSYSESITIKTDHQILNINVKYEIINGSLEFVNKTPIDIDVFPNRLGTADIFIQNRFDESVNITRIHFITYGLCFSFTSSNTSIDHISLQPNKIQKIGQVNFDMAPLCKSILPPSESTCYCGLNHHPEFKHEWDESISLMNIYELDHILIEKFRNLWKEWTSLLRKQRIQTNAWLYTNRANISWPITINFIWPSVLKQMSSSEISMPMIVDFQVTFINITKKQNVIITNPSSDLLTYSVMLLNNSSAISDRIFTISTTSKRVQLKDGLYIFNLQPDEEIVFTITYRPTSLIKHEAYLIVRNNLTIMESILIHGEGGIGGLQVGSNTIPIILEINANQYQLCSNPNGNPVLQKTLTLRNTGNMQTIISDISFGNFKCSGQGFSVSICQNILLEPHGKYDLKILYQPNYTTDEINEILSLNTNIGFMIFPIIVRIPQRVLSACYKTISRAPWELRSYCFGLCSLAVCIIFIYAAAIYNAQKLFCDYLIRAEWRNRIQIINNKIFDLSDLSSGIQDEQKLREQTESNQIIDIKKDIKQKRSINVNSTNRSITVNSKEMPQKTRRSTTDSNISKSSKQSIDASTKPLPSLRRQKSEQPTSSNTSKLMSSDDENEPFVLARSKRILSKRKGSFNNSSRKSITDNTLPIIQKSSPQDLIKLDDSTNDQQWHMVSSNKGQRKGTLSRRETSAEESQTINKISLIDHAKPMLLTSSLSLPRTHSSISRISIQSHRRRRHHHPHPPTKSSSPLLIPSLTTKRKSLKDDTSLINSNRELAFRQLTEQLWAAGLPSSTTACSMSIRSRCSSAPPSECGGDRNEITKMNWHINNNNNDDDDGGEEEEENIDWDEPDIPDEDFSRYTSQNEHTIDDLTDIDNPIQTQQKSAIPPLMSLSISLPIMTTNTQLNSTIPTSVTKENIEPLPFPQHGLGPIQRPNKLSCPLNIQSSFPHDSTRSPDTPEVLTQINYLVDHQNSITTIPTPIINDITTPNASWTPFSPPEWSTKYESSWPLNTQIQNPFAQRQLSKDETNLWQETPMNNTSWLKFTPVSPLNRQENETNNSLWNTSETSSTSWWPKTPSDENNNNQSRWEFAR